jgi:hypothetical protein
MKNIAEKGKQQKSNESYFRFLCCMTSNLLPSHLSCFLPDTLSDSLTTSKGEGAVVGQTPECYRNWNGIVNQSFDSGAILNYQS